MDSSFQDQLNYRYQAKVVRRRFTVVIGLCILLAGYILLAVSPDTPTEWALVRVMLGFAFLFIGFAIAVLPLISRLTGSDE